MSLVIPNKKDYKGMVEVHGQIDLNDFYYHGGEADADTVRLIVNVDSVRFRPDSNAVWMEDLKVFNDALIEKQKVISNSKIKIRLQGIDAPELHLQIDLRGYTFEKVPKEKRAKMWKRKFRQHWGARAVYELGKFLEKKTNSDKHTIDAYAFSRVDKPNDVFDKYGRFVGDIVLSKSKINLNKWLVGNGWAFHDFYNSMAADEISTLETKGAESRKKGLGIWKGYKNLLLSFDSEFYWKKNMEIAPMTDKGTVNIPKVFRRQVYYEEFKRAEVSKDASLSDYLAKGKDKCYTKKEFFKHGTKAKKHKLAEFLDTGGKIKFDPGTLIFIEDSSTKLKDKDGNPIVDWNHH